MSIYKSLHISVSFYIFKYHGFILIKKYKIVLKVFLVLFL